MRLEKTLVFAAILLEFVLTPADIAETLLERVQMPALWVEILREFVLMR